MFRFTPPPAPEPAPTPCPQCGASDAVLIYATARTEYLRCALCAHIRTNTVEARETHAAAG